jgi:hypothetical protein
MRLFKISALKMKDTALYELLLGLKTPWSVKKVDLSLADQRVVVEVVLKKGQVWADPTDATRRAPGVRLLVVLSDSYRHGPGAVKSG